MDSDQNKQTPVFDSEEVRRNAAWFAAGANKATTYSFIACLFVGPVVGYGSTFFGIGTLEVVNSITVGMLLAHAGIGQYLAFKARTVVRTETVKVDPF